jgi:VCBS repeat-containing protein
VANDDTASTTEDAGASGNVLTNDTDVDVEPLTVANPGTYVGAYGILTLAADGSYTYAPNAAAQGLDAGETAQDVFTYSASDGTASDSATLTVTVNGLNDAPVANDDTRSTNEDSAGVSGNVLANDTDVDGETLTVANPGTYVGAYGTLILAADGSYTYAPGAAAQGLDVGETAQDVFTYTASDGTAADSATLTVTVTGLNDAPVANDDTNATDENSPVSGNVLANDTDVDGETLHVANPATFIGAYGTLVLAADGSYTYTPGAAAALLNTGQSVVDVFSYTASDGTASDGAIITITVNGLSGAPNANDDSASTTENSSVSGNVLANDTDAENDPLTVTNPGTYAGAYGTLTLGANGSYTYAPNAAANGLAAGETAQDVFTYTASDGSQSDSANLTVTVNGVNDAPTIDAGGTDASGSVTELPDNDPDEGTAIHSDSGTIAFADPDLSDTHSASFAPQGGGYYGTFTLDPVDQSGDSVGWDFTVSDAALENLSEGQVVTQIYTIQIADGHGGSVSQDVTITINGAGVGTGPQTVWYIDNSAVGSTNVGTQANPFTSIAAFNAAQGTLGGPQVGHTVHLLAGTGTGVYAEADGINLLDGQVLIGDATGAVRPTIEATAGDGIDVAHNNTISGVDIGNTSGADIADSGGSVGTLTISDVGSSGTGQIVDIDQGGTLNVTLNGAESLGSAGGAIDLAGVGGSFMVTGATTITGVQSGGGIDITGSSLVATFGGGGNVATLTSTAVNYVGNSGALAIGGGFDIVTTSGAGLNASGGGTLTVIGAGNSIVSTTGTALSVVNTAIGAAGLTFESISSNGAASGIVLNSTGANGGLTVTGDSGSAVNGSGGTIAGSTGVGILLIGTTDVSLDQILVQNGLDDGIRGNNVTNFTLTHSTVTNNGDALQEHGADFTNLLGTGTFTDDTFSNNETSQVSIVNTSGTAQIAFTDLTASSTGVASAPNGLHGLHFETQGTANADLAVLDSAFDNLFSNSINVLNSGTGTLQATIADTTFNNVGASAINIAQNGSGTVRFDIHDNPTFLRGINNGISHSININQGGGAPAGAVLEGAISNNVIGNGSSTNSANSGGDGIRVVSVGAGTTTVRIDGNDIQGVGGNGINIQMSGSSNPAHTLNATVFDNHVTVNDPNSVDGIRVVAGSASGNAGILRLDMHDNDAASTNGNDFTVRERFATTVELLGYTGAPTDTAAVQNYFDNDKANDPLGPGNDWFITTQAPGGGFGHGASVPLPILPDWP